MYDRAIIVERGRGAKTNFPLHDYEQEIAAFEIFMETRCVWNALCMTSGLKPQQPGVAHSAQDCGHTAFNRQKDKLRGRGNMWLEGLCRAVHLM